MIVMLLIEAAIPGLVSIWFAAGALVALLVAALGASMWLQLIAFFLSSGVFLFLTRPLVKKYVNRSIQPTNADMIIGKECIVKERIDNVRGTGLVLAGGKMWTARSAKDDLIIEEGTRAAVERIEGVKAVVKPLE